MNETCSKADCTDPVKSRGLCGTHYVYAWRHGTLPPKTPAPVGCSVEDCPEPHEARGLCARHYHRYYERGSVKLTAPQRRMPPEERFRFYVSEEPCACGHGCLLWKGGKNGQGYGAFYLDGKHVLAHRYAYELDVEPIPPLHQVDHVRKRGCRHRDCVNVAHLEPVTLEENLRRAQPGRRSDTGAKTAAAFHRTRVARFWVKVSHYLEPDVHWLWQAFIERSGNARVWWEGNTRMARDVAWLLTYGAIPDEFIPYQTCGRGDCMNPAHMKLVSRAEDQARRAALARAGKQPAQMHPNRSTGNKLTAEIVAKCRLRFAAGESQIALAVEFGVSDAAMSTAIRGKTWAGLVNGVAPVTGKTPVRRSDEFHARMAEAGRKGAAARWHPDAPLD